jgi:plastocyanin
MHISRFAALAALSLLAISPAAAQPASQTIQVWNFGFAPQPLHLRAGQPVTLRFVNQSGSSHDFTAPAFFKSARMVAGGVPNGEIELPPHATRTITLVPRAGVYNAHCSHFLHKQLGMQDVISVD